MKSFKVWVVAGLLVTFLVPASTAVFAETDDGVIQGLMDQISSLVAQVGSLKNVALVSATATSTIATSTTPLLYHDADRNKDYKISDTELGGVVTIFNSTSGYSCLPGATSTTSWPWYAGVSNTAKTCRFFNGDTNKDWKIDFQELFRVTQFKNSDGYQVSTSTVDGFNPVQIKFTSFQNPCQFTSPNDCAIVRFYPDAYVWQGNRYVVEDHLAVEFRYSIGVSNNVKMFFSPYVNIVNSNRVSSLLPSMNSSLFIDGVKMNSWDVNLASGKKYDIELRYEVNATNLPRGNYWSEALPIKYRLNTDMFNEIRFSPFGLSTNSVFVRGVTSSSTITSTSTPTVGSVGQSTTTVNITQSVSNVSVSGLNSNSWTNGQIKNISWASTGLGTSTVDIILCNSIKCWPGAMNTPNDGNQDIKLYASDKPEGSDYYIKVRKYLTDRVSAKSPTFTVVKPVTTPVATSTSQTSAILLGIENLLFDMSESLLGQ